MCYTVKMNMGSKPEIFMILFSLVWKIAYLYELGSVNGLVWSYYSGNKMSIAATKYAPGMLGKHCKGGKIKKITCLLCPYFCLLAMQLLQGSLWLWQSLLLRASKNNARSYQYYWLHRSYYYFLFGNVIDSVNLG